MKSHVVGLLLVTSVSFLLGASQFAQGTNNLPTGTLDKVEATNVDGWSLDPDTPDKPVTVRFYIDAPYPQGEFAGEVETNLMREDVNKAKNVSGLHGFHWNIPAKFHDGKVHKLYAYGVDTFDDNKLGILYGVPKEFQIDQAPVIQVNGQPYTIGVWYFTAWSSYNDEQAVTSISTYGRKDAWGGVRDHAEGDDPWGIKVDYSNREPLIGFYDLADQSVMDTHIRQAASAGISYFAFYWYWDPQTNRESTISLPLHTFLTSPYKDKLKFVLAPISYLDKPMTREAWSEHLVPFMIENYFGDPSYMTTSDGKPVVILFSTGFYTVDDDKFAVETLRDQVRERMGVDPFILWLYNPDYNPEHTAYVASASGYGVDGFICFQYGPERPGEPYTEMLGRWQMIMNKLSGYFHVPCASTGFDARPWYRITWGNNNQSVNSLNYNTDINLSAFSDHLKQVKAYLDSQPSETSRTLVIYAWNEWGEGGIVEPSRVGGYEYLDTIQNIFGLTSQAARPPLQPIEPAVTKTSPPPTSSSPTPKSPTGLNPLCNFPALGLVLALSLFIKRRR